MPPQQPPTRRLLAVSLLCGAATATCVPSSDDSSNPVDVRQRHHGILIEDLPELGGDYPDVLIDGLSRQLIDELNCTEPGVLVEFEIAQEPGSLYTENNIPLMLRPEALEAAEAVAALEGDYMTITSGYRDVGMQYYDYLRGQRFGFLAARPGNSRHQNGQAIDVEFNGFWVDKLIDYGWSWPLGERDAPHFEWGDNPVPDLRRESVRAFQRLWNQNNPDDLLEEDGVFGPASESRLAVTPAEGFPFGGCDRDLDGFASVVIGGLDCDDERSDVNPDGQEICGDGIDQDCDGADLPCDVPDADLPMDAPQPPDDVPLTDAEPAPQDTTPPEDTAASPPDTNTTPDAPEPNDVSEQEDVSDSNVPDTDGLADVPQGVGQSAAKDDSCGCQTCARTPSTPGLAFFIGLILGCVGLRKRRDKRAS